MQPDEYLVIFASGEDIGEPAAGGSLHTDFKLSARGEYLGLYDAGGSVVHEFSPGFPAQDYFHSWGWDDVNSGFRYFASPTPGNSNSANGLTSIAEIPQFDHDSGFYDNTINLGLSTPTLARLSATPPTAAIPPRPTGSLTPVASIRSPPSHSRPWSIPKS